MPTSSKSPSPSLGLFAAAGAFTIWGLLPLYWHLLRALPLPELVSLRLICLFLFLLSYLFYTGRLQQSLAVFQKPKQALILLLSGLFLAATWSIDISGIINGYVMEVSLGYFITPLLNILMGYLIFKDPLSRTSLLAIALAAMGVFCQIIILGRFPTIALSLGAVFAIYGLIRKLAATEAMTGLFIESLYFLPFGLAYFMHLLYSDSSELLRSDTQIWLMTLTLGPITAMPLVWFSYSVRRVSMITFGILQYLAPSIVFLLGIFVFEEPLSTAETLTFACIWTALILYSWESIRKRSLRKRG